MRSSSFASPLTMACAACGKKTGQINQSNHNKSSDLKTRNDSQEILGRGTEKMHNWFNISVAFILNQSITSNDV